jgi:RNA polymerase sigma factor (sigma-70 family)
MENMDEKLSFEELLEQYKKLVYSIAKSYRNSNIPQEDLIQEGLLGLYKAREHYDSQKETKFSTYAVFWIKKQMLEAISRENGISGITDELHEDHENTLIAPEQPEECCEDTLKLPGNMPALEQTILRLSFSKHMCLKEIAKLLNISVERVKQHKQKALRRLRNSGAYL